MSDYSEGEPDEELDGSLESARADNGEPALESATDRPDGVGSEPRRRATALQYEPGTTAPKVVATGSGYVADQIVRAAQEAGVPVRSDPALANALASLDLGAEVPQELYRSLAETLAWAYRLDRNLAQGRR